jgi:hypothetical protein
VAGRKEQGRSFSAEKLAQPGLLGLVFENGIDLPARVRARNLVCQGLDQLIRAELGSLVRVIAGG